jgi:hypothetical protein
MQDDTPSLGTCCTCESGIGVTTIVMLPLRGPVPGRGWGCAVCNMPPDGAVAVLCEACVPAYSRDRASLRFACRGYPRTGGRVPIGELSEPFAHDPGVDHG